MNTDRAAKLRSAYYWLARDLTKNTTVEVATYLYSNLEISQKQFQEIISPISGLSQSVVNNTLLSYITTRGDDCYDKLYEALLASPQASLALYLWIPELGAMPTQVNSSRW